MIYRAWKYEDILPITALEEVCFGAEAWNFSMFAQSFEQNGFFGELCETGGEEDEADGVTPLLTGDENAAVSGGGAQGKGRQLVAYGCVQCVLEEGDLLNVAVHPAFRRQGIGRVMLKRLCGGAKRRGVEKLFLEVRKSNAAAQALYCSEGFERISERKKYYPDGEDAFLLMKKL